jgi:acyl-homoserine-lactone acylase
VPLRDERIDYRWTVDGSDPKADWRGLYTLDGLPMVRNPPSGFVYNSNDAPWMAAGKGTFAGRHFAPYMDQWGYRARSTHALQLLDNHRIFTPEALMAAAYDRAQPGFDRILPPLFAAYDALAKRDPRRAALAPQIALLKAWDRRWARDSEAQTLAVHYGEAIWDKVMTGVRTTTDEETAYARISQADRATRLAALDSAIGKMTQLYGRWRVPWGDINRYQRNDGAIVQRFDDAKPSLAVGFPSARWGSLASFGARTYPGTVRRYGTNGNSFVAVVEFAKDGPRAWAVTAGGVNGDPSSPHFADQAQAYADGHLIRVPLTDAEVAAQSLETYSPGRPRKTR